MRNVRNDSDMGRRFLGGGSSLRVEEGRNFIIVNYTGTWWPTWHNWWWWFCLPVRFLRNQIKLAQLAFFFRNCASFLLRSSFNSWTRCWHWRLPIVLPRLSCPRREDAHPCSWRRSWRWSSGWSRTCRSSSPHVGKNCLGTLINIFIQVINTVSQWKALSLCLLLLFSHWHQKQTQVMVK